MSDNSWQPILYSNIIQQSILLVFRNSKEPLRMPVGYYMLYGIFCKTFSENNVVNLERKKKKGPDGSLRYRICRSSPSGTELVFQLKTT